MRFSDLGTIEESNEDVDSYVISYDESYTPVVDPDDAIYESDTQKDSNFRYRDLMFQPNHVVIDKDETVSVVKDGTVLYTDTWFNCIRWIDRNWDVMNGIYQITRKGEVLYTNKFQVTNAYYD